MKKIYKVGYTQGVYDMFHVGHLNLLNNAKAQCDYLIVGINADSLVESYKKKTPVIQEANRCRIVQNIKAVDQAVIVHTLDKTEILKDIHYDVIFIGSDWSNDERWKRTVEEMKQYNVDVVFLPHTDGVSSTELRPVEKNSIKE